MIERQIVKDLFSRLHSPTADMKHPLHPTVGFMSLPVGRGGGNRSLDYVPTLSPPLTSLSFLLLSLGLYAQEKER